MMEGVYLGPEALWISQQVATAWDGNMREFNGDMDQATLHTFTFVYELACNAIDELEGKLSNPRSEIIIEQAVMAVTLVYACRPGIHLHLLAAMRDHQNTIREMILKKYRNLSGG